MAGLDYRVSVESGSLTVHTHSLSWRRVRSLNITVPPAVLGLQKAQLWAEAECIALRILGIDGRIMEQDSANRCY